MHLKIEIMRVLEQEGITRGCHMLWTNGKFKIERIWETGLGMSRSCPAIGDHWLCVRGGALGE